MSEDRFYIKDLQPIREFCLNSGKEDIYKYIYSLQQEIQQLKEEKNHMSHNYTKYIQERDKQLDKYKEVIEEVREYITNTVVYEDLGDGYSYNCDKYEEEKLLQILDKARVGDK